MADTVSCENRSAIMQKIRSTDTKPEMRLRRSLWHAGLRYRVHVRTLPGRPDLAIKSSRVAIFVDSCFWHGCGVHGRIPKSNVEYWTRKIASNKERDRKVNEQYQAMRWTVVRVWEHDLVDLGSVTEQVLDKILHSDHRTFT